MSPEELSGVKTQIQKIIDNHLEEDQRFSIKDLDEESTFLINELLLEKDKDKREQKRANIKGKIKTNEMNTELTYNQITKIKDQLTYQKNTINDLGHLNDEIIEDKKLNEKLKNI
jgi:hypothetical protein